MLGYWLYISDALPQPRSIDDALIYLQAFNRNPTHRITGYLHREESHYAQYVEGPWQEVGRLRFVIERDGRHRNVRTLAEGTLDARRFAGWDMAFSTIEMASFRSFQRERGRPEELSLAPVEDIVGFMEDTARRGAAAPQGSVPSMTAA